jgi:hypothetical protein
MKEAVERIMKAFLQKHETMTPEHERKVRDEISDFVAELLSKRATQIAKFGGTEPSA